jgi:hypothetical protein
MNKYVPIIVAFATGLGLGGIGGFSAGVVSTDLGKKFIRQLNTIEEPAGVAKPKSIARKRFTIQHPDNWVVDTSMDDYDPDTYFTIESPGGASTMLTIYNYESIPKDDTQSQVDFYKTYVNNLTKKEFRKWGQYSGYGVELKGKISGITPGRIRIFSYSNALKSFTIIEQQYDADASKTQPGFDLVEKSFALK